MKIVRLLFLVPPILYAAHATAQDIINIPTTNSRSEITETDIQPREPTAEELANPVVIKYGRNGDREIPIAMALRSYARFALRRIDDPTRRESWYDLDEKKEAALKTILNQFLTDYEQAENNLRAESCNIYYVLKGQSLDAAAETNAYELLREEITEAEPLVAPTLAVIRTEISDSMADVVEGAVEHIIETSSMGVHDQGAFNARHGISAEQHFSKTCR